MKDFVSATIEAHAPKPGLASDASRRTASRESPSLLVAIASYGRKQDHYLEQVLGEYRKLKIPCRIVVLTEAPKPVMGAELLIGLPSTNTYSLPFAHRKLFADHAADYDFFIYTEDDTLITAAHIEAFLSVQKHLTDDEILGFIRSEQTPEGGKYITSIHHHFRWLPESIEQRGGELFAQFSNEHSGCFIATRAQLQRAISSGGFMVEPHDEMYGMLEAAASDIYRQCGLRRLLCLSRLDEFIVPHLANKYFGEMGIPLQDLHRHVAALRDVHENDRWRGKLFQPESRAPRFQWSKNLYETPDRKVLAALPTSPGKVLSVGVAAGRLEEALRSNGVDVKAIALDAVFAGVLTAKGIDAVAGPLDESLARLGGQLFDTVVVDSVLHLVPDPIEWLRKLRGCLAPSGLLIAKIDNTGEWSSWLKDVWQARQRTRLPQFESSGVQPVSRGVLRRWCRNAGLQVLDLVPQVSDARRQRLGALTSDRFGHLVAGTFILKAKRVP
jgi:2-polyprenyl-3-methyl-5-hydroxy-6-metoxy-1,4-benzoquinol methylase